MSFIDRRAVDKEGSINNRQKFLRRHKDSVKEAVRDTVVDGSIKGVGDKKAKVKVRRGIRDPMFNHAPDTGIKRSTHPGNKEFNQGDRIPQPRQGAGRGNKAGDGEDGQDEFEFELSREEFMSIFFEDLELPDFIKESLNTNKSFEYKRGGYSPDGDICRLNILQSMKKANMRLIGQRAALKRQEDDLREAAEEAKTEEAKKALLDEAQDKNRRRKKLLFLDEIDLRYNRVNKEPNPNKKAVMFCLMDVSGSMGQEEKDIAKRFYILLDLFLEKNYDDVEVVFVRHTTVASEVNERTFFYDRANGGTIMSSGAILVNEIIDERFPLNEWNIYVAQASDGDNFDHDVPVYQRVLEHDLLSKVQYYAYLEIDVAYSYFPQGQGTPSATLDLLTEMKKAHKNLQVQSVESINEIYGVFRKLFDKTMNKKGV